MTRPLDRSGFGAVPAGTLKEWDKLLRLARMIEIDAAAGTVTITNGEASIALRDDGRVVVKGTDVVIDANRNVAVLAGAINLN